MFPLKSLYSLELPCSAVTAWSWKMPHYKYCNRAHWKLKWKCCKVLIPTIMVLMKIRRSWISNNKWENVIIIEGKLKKKLPKEICINGVAGSSFLYSELRFSLSFCGNSFSSLCCIFVKVGVEIFGLKCKINSNLSFCDMT